MKFKFNSKKGYYFPMFPIIVTKNNEIIDGQHRYAICQQMNLPLEAIVLPFTKEEINTKECISALIEIQAYQDEQLEIMFKKYRIDFRTQILHSAAQNKITKFYQFKDSFKDDSDYWESLREAYVMSSNNRNNQDKIKELFSSERRNRNSFMYKEELDELNNLPSEVSIYRGMTVEEKESGIFGISWTLDKSIAEIYATSYVHNYDTFEKPKTVLNLTINKSDIIACFLDRGEKEIIYFS